MPLNLLVAVCLACWSTWGILDKKALDSATHLDVLLFQHIIYLIEIPLSFAIILYLYHACALVPQAWLWTGMASTVSSLATLFYLLALSKAEASYVLGITASYPIFVQFFACLWLGESLVGERLLGSILVVGGVTLIGSSKQAAHPTMIGKSDAEHRRRNFSILLICALATFCWGVTGLLDKKAVMLDLPIKIYFARCLWDALICLIMYLVYRAIKHKVDYGNKRAWKFSFLSALCLSLGTLCYLFAMAVSSASYVIVITGCYPLFMYLFAVLFLKERLSKLRSAGMLLVVIGGLMVQATQSQ
ncbi:MAG: DMT family transporter [Cyanobacteria bacterium REEB67]|nr:DMT family transporter [Cyanobacteria bacterium REEB67]